MYDLNWWINQFWSRKKLCLTCDQTWQTRGKYGTPVALLMYLRNRATTEQWITVALFQVQFMAWYHFMDSLWLHNTYYISTNHSTKHTHTQTNDNVLATSACHQCLLWSTYILTTKITDQVTKTPNLILPDAIKKRMNSLNLRGIMTYLKKG